MKKIVFTCFTFLAAVSASQAQATLDLESGAVFGSAYNEVRVPGNDGTLFDIAKDFHTDPTFFFRIRASYILGKRHTISALYAPLTVRSSGTPASSIRFNGATFGESIPVDIRYQFNSYRLTYRYDIVSNDRLKVGIGLTGKVRDAAIQLSNSQASATKTNLGVVPLINFYVGWQVTERFKAILEGDALVGKQGRAEDIFAGFGYQFNEHLGLKAGYRVLEGGADNDEVYNFTWYNYAAVGLLLTF